jgi:hypothetical protein
MRMRLRALEAMEHTSLTFEPSSDISAQARPTGAFAQLAMMSFAVGVRLKLPELLDANLAFFDPVPSANGTIFGAQPRTIGELSGPNQ